MKTYHNTKQLINGSKKWNGGRPVYVTTENKGAGSFLEPPFSKTHQFGIVAGYDHGNGYQEYASIEYYLNNENVPNSAKRQIKSIIGKEEKPPIDDPAIQEWILHVLGYFKSCYVGQDKQGNFSWNASDLVIEKNSDPVLNANNHAGVHFIRKYYPDFMPTQEHFDKAYWGQK